MNKGALLLLWPMEAKIKSATLTDEEWDKLLELTESLHARFVDDSSLSAGIRAWAEFEEARCLLQK
jgi:hypothetical protein